MVTHICHYKNIPLNLHFMMNKEGTFLSGDVRYNDADLVHHSRSHYKDQPGSIA